MNFALVYAGYRFVYRLFEFLKHWYLGGFLVFGHAFIGFLERLDRTLALKITWRNFFKPLYGDYTVLGRILGVIFRSLRILAAAVLYGAVFLGFSAAYLLWALVPVYVVLRIAAG